MAEGAAHATKPVPGAVVQAPAQVVGARRVFSEPGQAAERSASARSPRAMIPGRQREVSSVLDVVGKGGGRPLAPEVRKEMEQWLSADFSEVRIHTDAKAAESAEILSAEAYTVGNEIVFGPGFFDPHSSAGQARLAHELSHVQQQRKGPVSGADTGRGVVVSHPSDPFEQQAQMTAGQVLPSLQPTAGGAWPGGGGPVVQQQAGQLALQRQPKTSAKGPGPSVPVTSPTYQIGGVPYQEGDFDVAVNRIAGLWTDANGILAKRKEAVAEFCGPGGVVAEEKGSLTQALLEGAITGLLAVATDGLGNVVAGILKKGVTVVAERVSANPEVVLKMSEKIVEKAVDKGKEEGKKAISDAVKKALTSGGTKLATPAATYQSALDDSLDKDTEGSTNATLTELLGLKHAAMPAEYKWATAAAIYDSLHASAAEAKRLQWDATSDGWFSMHTASGIGTFLDIDQGIVSILLSDAYPTETLKAKGAYLGGPGANEATVEKYNERPLGEIRILKRIIMDGGNLGHGLVDCQWEIVVNADGSLMGPKNKSRWGFDWLAAKKLGLRDIDKDKVTAQNIVDGTAAVWEELRHKSARQLGSTFKVTGVTSGTGAYAPPKHFFQTGTGE